MKQFRLTVRTVIIREYVVEAETEREAKKMYQNSLVGDEHLEQEFEDTEGYQITNVEEVEE